MIFVVLVLVIILRFQQSKINFADGQRIRITTTILNDPIIYEKQQYFKLYDLKIYLPIYPSVSYGDRVVIEGIVDGTRLKKPTLIDLEQPPNIFVKFRSRLLGFYKKSLPSDEAALVSGVVLGSKSSITPDFWEQLKNSGTAHVVVASGMNVTLLAGFIITLLASLVGRRTVIIITLATIWIYALLCGMEAPIVRAAIMTSIALIAQRIGRVNYALRSLFITAYIMVVINPNWLSDIGFQLSFLATFSLMFFSKRIDKAIKSFKIFRILPNILADSLGTTISAQIGVVPLLFITFGRYNPLSIIANTLSLWVIPILTVAGFIAGMVGLIYNPIGKLILYLMYPLAKYFTYVVEMFGV